MLQEQDKKMEPDQMMQLTAQMSAIASTLEAMRTQQMNHQRILDSLHEIQPSTSYSAPQENAHAGFDMGIFF